MTDIQENLPSTRPYLVRAIWEWCMDTGETPQILVDANYSGTDVPQEYIKDGVIVLNIHERAVHGLIMNNDSVSFSARFAGVSRNIFVPVEAVLAIYGREHGQGLFFDTPSKGEEQAAETAQTDSPDDDDNNPKPPKGKPNLRVV